ncbi:MAG: NAD-dependent epimerase/dehydratase family protein [Candidatus Wallbacteria bacterium]|nr:NAD-dependent epimerase/dehydratase family protein [Candidatus Wallbacteria bacterium]
MKILVTGGAGFVGSHLVDLLLERGHQVRVLDNLEPQVHGAGRGRPEYLHAEAELVVGDVRDRDAVRHALRGVEAVFHQAAAVGVGQSMYEIERYVSANSLGAAVLLDAIHAERKDLAKMVVASSMSIYGEGLYVCEGCGPVHPRLRPDAQLSEHDWEMRCPGCRRIVAPAPTPEDKPLYPTSVYAVTKRDHEELFLSVGEAYRIPTVALRYFNIYGPRQALSNPYTGVAAIFSCRMLSGNAPSVFEDGLQSRDFVHVRDIARANLLALENSGADYQAVNVGSGRGTTLRELISLLASRIGYDGHPDYVQRFRAGDIRHCSADITRARKLLGFEPSIDFEQGVDDLAAWARTQRPIDAVDTARAELARHGLIRQ